MLLNIKSIKRVLLFNLISLHEEPDYPIAYRYAFMMLCIYTTSFYAPLIPEGILWICLGLALVYVIEKIKILRLYSVKFSVGKDLSI